MFHNKDYIYRIYKEGSFSKAAESLRISQPSLSSVVSRLEQQLGVQLFNRKTRPITVTSFGLEYIHAIENIYEIEEHLKILADEEHHMQRGNLSIGGSSLDKPYVITEAIARFKKEYPLVQLRIYDMTSLASRQMLDTGQLDLIITNQPMDSLKYESVFCYDEHLIWAIPADFPVNEQLQDRALHEKELGDKIFQLPQSRCVSASELTDIPFILLDNTNYLRTCSDMIFQESDIQPTIALEVETPSIAYNFVMQGVGATLISNRVMEKCKFSSEVCYYRIQSHYGKRSAYAYYCKGRHVTTAMKKFLAYLNGDTNSTAMS